MDHARFDALTRALASGGTRRGLFRRAAATTLASAGLARSHPKALGQTAATSEIAFPVQPICTCPGGLVLCAGLCVQPGDCEPAQRKEPADPKQDQADGAAEDANAQASCGPQEQFCRAQGICVPCPAAMSLDRDCRCFCPEGTASDCSAQCDCPRVAVCNCVCPGPPCAPPRVQHADTCACVCPNACSAGMVHDDACQCVCPAGATLCGGRCIACPPEGTLNPDFCDCVCDTIRVPTDGTTVSSTLSLVNGRQYTIRVSGRFNIGGGRFADAEYVFDPNDNLQLNRCGAYGGDIGLTIDDPARSRPTKTPPSWGAYTTAHVYTTRYTGTGNPVAFTYNDCIYGDNRGTLTVEILCACDFAACDGACCAQGEVCNTTVDPPQCCAPTDSCPSGSCGEVPDNCGGTIDRGPCPEQVCQIGVCNANGGCNGCAYVRVRDNRPGGLCSGAGEVCCGGACCAGGQVCANGVCCTPGGTCPAGFCGSVPDGCGGQITCQCAAGLECCGTSCQNTVTSSAHCGRCGTACARGLVCQRGRCVCPAGRTLCDRRCIACPPGGRVNDRFCDCVCDTIDAPTNGTAVSSNLVLVSGQQYTIRVSGRFTIGGGRFADAEYVFDPNDNLQLNRCGAYNGDIGLTINDPNLSRPTKTPASWGAYNTAHVYTTTVTGTGNPLSFTYNDCIYDDNRGTLTVEIFCPRRRGGDPVGSTSGTAVPPGDPEPTSTPTAGPTGPTGATATVTPSSGGGTGAVGPAGPTATSIPAPTPTSTPTPTGPPSCNLDELLCIDRCIPASDCPAEQCCFDAASCTCTCPDCGANTVFDPGSCACVCTLGGCPPNFLFDETACSCVCQPTPCAPGSNWVFDTASCSCVCIPAACPANYVFDEASCSCVCLPPACPANYQFDAASCACFCAEVGCAEGEVFDLASCACLPSGGTGETQGTA